MCLGLCSQDSCNFPGFTKLKTCLGIHSVTVMPRPKFPELHNHVVLVIREDKSSSVSSPPSTENLQCFASLRDRRDDCKNGPQFAHTSLYPFPGIVPSCTASHLDHVTGFINGEEYIDAGRGFNMSAHWGSPCLCISVTLRSTPHE